MAGFGDLYFKNNIPFISNKWNVIILLINGGVVILIIMGLSSYGIKYFIKKANLIKPISEQSKWKDQKKYISEKEKLSNMMKKSYSFACLGLIIPMLFVNVEVAVLWIIILAGGWLWFGTYDVESSMPKKFIINTVYKFNKKDWIFHSIMFLLLFVLMISVEYQSENTMDIILGIFGGMFFMGVLMMFLGNKLLKV
ncbi:hypothetical protein J2Z35_002698 [Acetoanaerobium pronyense]|uniref:Uncharacterized protein n=1 Tax=Acetoanaerobium pronyense TaxID=1482736 RepID=A0ABS4KNF8_9FIRM|nr:hypothetical protein [Acetoanaerobium pronyense]MBP2028860.1 hypothetical protein [Acetoanaerobium pronyense]